MNREQKAELVTQLREKLQDSAFILLVHYRGLKDKELFDLRVGLKSQGANLKIVKNTLAKVAIKDSDYDSLSEHLSGPVGICYATDPVVLSKVITTFSKDLENLKVLVGYLNKQIISEKEIANLSKLGSLEEVRGSFLGILNGAQSKFVRVLTAPATSVVSVLNNYADSKK